MPSAPALSEDHIQSTCVAWLRTVLPKAVVAAIPNGGLRTKREAAKHRWTGTLAGIPDVVAALPGGAVLWIECKAAKGVLSSEQKACHAALAAAGHTVAVVRSVEDVRAALRSIGINTREAA